MKLVNDEVNVEVVKSRKVTPQPVIARKINEYRDVAIAVGVLVFLVFIVIHFFWSQ